MQDEINNRNVTFTSSVEYMLMLETITILHKYYIPDPFKQI